MSDKQAAPAAGENPELRGQLIRRLGVAAGLVAVLLGLLAVFDHLSKAPEEQELPVFTKPVPVAPRKMVTQPVTPVEPQGEPAPAATAAEPPAPPVVAAPEAPPPPSVESQPAVPSTARKPAAAPSIPSAPAAASATARPAVTARPEPVQGVPEATAPPAIVPPTVAEAPAPMAATAAPTARVVQRQPAGAAPRLFSGFVLQAGVFASAQRAEELHATLALSGLPSSIETRVQVGPFKTRQEAELAQQKLRELGIHTLLVPPGGKP